MNPKLKIVLLLAIAMSLFIIFCDSPNEPDEEEPGEHLFYIAPNVGNMVKIFSVEQEAFIDSIVVDSVSATDTMVIHVIGDDSLLAVSAGSKTYVVALDSNKIIETFPVRWPVFSRDSKYYISQYSSLGSNGLYCYPGHELILATSFGIFPTFSNDGKKIISKNLEGSLYNELWLRIYSTESGLISERHLGDNLFSFFSFASDKYEEIFIDIADAVHYLGTVDYDSDTLKPIRLYGGDAAVVPLVTPNDEIAVYSDIGVSQFGYVHSGKIYFYNVSLESIEDSVTIEGFNMVGQMVISNDSKYLVAGPYNVTREFTNILLIDLENYCIIGTYDFGSYPGIITSKYCSRNGRSL